jgi:hypothetical protein
MSQQEEGQPQRRTRLVFSRQVNEEIKRRFENALKDAQNNEEAAMEVVLNWLWNNRAAERPETQAFRQLLDHFIKVRWRNGGSTAFKSLSG